MVFLGCRPTVFEDIDLLQSLLLNVPKTVFNWFDISLFSSHNGLTNSILIFFPDLELYNEVLKVIHDFPQHYPFEMATSGWALCTYSLLPKDHCQHETPFSCLPFFLSTCIWVLNVYVQFLLFLHMENKKWVLL